MTLKGGRIRHVPSRPVVKCRYAPCFSPLETSCASSTYQAPLAVPHEVHKQAFDRRSCVSILARIHRSGGGSLADMLRTLAATAGATRLARSNAGRRRFGGISLCILALTSSLVAACGGGGGGGGSAPPPPPPVSRPGAPTGITVTAGN